MIEKLFSHPVHSARLLKMKEKIYEEVMTHLTSRVQKLLEIRAGPDMEVGAALFSKVYGLLGKTGNTEALIQKITEE